MMDLASAVIEALKTGWDDDALTRAKKDRIEFTYGRSLPPTVKPYIVQAVRDATRLDQISTNLALKRETIQIHIYVKPAAKTREHLAQAEQDRLQIELEVERILGGRKTSIPDIYLLTLKRAVHSDEAEALHTTVEVSFYVGIGRYASA